MSSNVINDLHLFLLTSFTLTKDSKIICISCQKHFVFYMFHITFEDEL